MKALRNLRLIGAWLAALVLGGTLGFHLIEGWSWFDSFYTVLVTITTIGYTGPPEMTHAGRIFNVFIIVGGVGLVFLGIGALAASLLEFELQTFFGRRRMERQIGRLNDHYIICGAGRVGRSAARELVRKPAPFVIIESVEGKAAKLPEDWLVMMGDATQESVLRQARIERARGLVAATTTDATNIYIVLTARSLNPQLTILARASEEESEKHLKTAGADSVISPYAFAGHRIAQAFLRPNVLDFLDIATARKAGKLALEIEEIRIGENSRFAGATIEGSRIRQELGVIVLAIKSGQEMRFNPAPEDRIAAGDYLIAMGESGGLRRLEESATAVK